MLRIRFQRIGKKNQPFLKLVVVDRNSPPKGGRFEKVGWLNPLTKEKGLKAERVKYWLSVGAQPTDRVYNWLLDEGILSGGKRAVHARKKSQSEESETTPVQGAPPVPAPASASAKEEGKKKEEKAEKGGEEVKKGEEEVKKKGKEA